ncbi:MAG: hypothetical protein AB7P94_17295 [Steroidobacteraceae bacterium]
MKHTEYKSGTWYEIETAPKDGSFILMGRVDWKIPFQGSFKKIYTGEVTWTRLNHHDINLIPSHWMPLPEPPKEDM